MSKKRFSQVVDEMHLDDINNGSTLVCVCTDFVRSSLTKKGTEITIGAPLQTSHDLLNEKVMPILLLVNKEEYFKRIEDNDGE